MTAWATREEALQAISECSSYDELFDVANQALGSAREKWGDDMKSSAHLAYLWSTAAFPVAAKDRLDIHGIDKSFNIEGDRFVAAGLAAAKLVATQLLSPCANKKQMEGLLFYNMIEKVQTVTATMGKGFPSGLPSVHMLCGSQFTLHISLNRLSASLSETAMDTWGDLDQHLSPPRIQKPWESDQITKIMEALDEQPEPPDDIFCQMMDHAGFQHIRCGPPAE
jgi:hypothetical protein